MPLQRLLLVVVVALAVPAGADLTISTYAGVPSTREQIDGSVSIAQFDKTKGIASDGSGNFYLADQRTVRRISPDGSVATAAGRGLSTGPLTGVGGEAHVEPHNYIAFGGGYVFFAFANLGTIQRLNVASGLVEHYVGAGFGFQDGSTALFRGPLGMAVAPDGTLFIADHGNQVIRKVTTDRITSTFAGLPQNHGYANGSGTNVRFNTPLDVTIDSSGNVYVADAGNRRIRKITPAGVVSTLAGGGTCPRQDGNGTAACFASVYSLTIDADDNLYVAETDGFLWSADASTKTYIRKITPAGTVTTVGQTAAGTYVHGSIAFRDGFLYLPLASGARVVRMDLAGTVTDFTGNPPPRQGNGDGPKATAQFNPPRGIDFDSGGNAFVLSGIRKIDGTGTVSTSPAFGSIDIAIDSSDNLYVTGPHEIHRITPAGSDSVFAGSGQPGYQEGTGSAARFSAPAGIWVTGSTIYVADTNNRVIRRINSLGETSLVAGLPGVKGTSDGSGFNVNFNETRDVVGNSSGDLFVSDGLAIRKIDSTGNVTTFAGSGTQAGTNDGTGTSARFTSTQGIDIDSSGNLWVVDSHAIRKVTPGGVVTTEAGAITTSSLINGTGTDARFAGPQGVAATSSGIFIADTSNYVIRQGVMAIADRASIDASTGSVGFVRQLGTTAATATSWQWSIVRRPATSSATLSATNVREPTFTPDVPDYYRFRLIASNSSGTTVSEVELLGQITAPAITSSTPHFHSLHRPTTVRVYGANFHPSITATVGGVPYPVTFINSQEVRITLPAAVNPTSDTHNIVLTNPDTQSVSVQHWFASGPEGGYGRGDFNGDGREEIFWRNLATGENALWVMDGANPSLIATSTYLPTVSIDWTPAAFADFNGDLTSDVLWRNYHTGENAIWLMSNLALAQGVYISSVDSPVQWHIAGAGDVNSDGYADIIWRNYHPDQIATGIWFMNGTNRIGTLALPTSPLAGTPSAAWVKYDQIVTVRDFNGNGRADILWRNTSQSSQEIWLLDGTSNPGVSVLPPSSARPRVAADFDGDGDPDIVFENPYAYWTMNGASMSSGAFLPNVPDANMKIKGAARIGNDPRAALLWRNFVTGENACWYITPGGGAINGAYIPSVPDSNWEIIGPR